MKYTRVYADDTGKSHFEDVEVPMSPVNFAPPAPPLNASEFIEASRLGFLRADAGWFGDWHPAPRKQFILVTGGTWSAATSDGETRQFVPGDVVLLEDTTGDGHTTRIVGDEDATAVVVQL